MFLTTVTNSSGSVVLTSTSKLSTSAKRFEQDGLALHHRLGRHVAEVAEAEDGGAVGDDGDQIALGRVVVGLVDVLGDGQDRHGHARRIGQRQVPLRRHRA
jgi:hypothetical protein